MYACSTQRASPLLSMYCPSSIACCITVHLEYFRKHFLKMTNVSAAFLNVNSGPKLLNSYHQLLLCRWFHLPPNVFLRRQIKNHMTLNQHTVHLRNTVPGSQRWNFQPIDTCSPLTRATGSQSGGLIHYSLLAYAIYARQIYSTTAIKKVCVSLLRRR